MPGSRTMLVVESRSATRPVYPPAPSRPDASSRSPTTDAVDGEPQPADAKALATPTASNPALD